MEQKKMVSVVKQNPENKVYLICLRTEEGDMWDIVEGRLEAWEYIKDKCIYTNVNVEESFILVDTLTLNKRKPIYNFMKYTESMIENTDGFDIEDYVKGDVIESTEDRDAEQESASNDETADRQFSMQSLMNGDYSTRVLK